MEFGTPTSFLQCYFDPSIDTVYLHQTGYLIAQLYPNELKSALIEVESIAINYTNFNLLDFYNFYVENVTKSKNIITVRCDPVNVFGWKNANAETAAASKPEFAELDEVAKSTTNLTNWVEAIRDENAVGTMDIPKGFVFPAFKMMDVTRGGDMYFDVLRKFNPEYF